jgi:hypothetical protein
MSSRARRLVVASNSGDSLYSFPDEWILSSKADDSPLTCDCALSLGQHDTTDSNSSSVVYPIFAAETVY